MAVAADACAAPAPTNPNPLRPSPALDQAVLSTVLSATALEGPTSDRGARKREKVDVVAFTSPSTPTASLWSLAAWMPATVANSSVFVPSGICAEWKENRNPPFFFIQPAATDLVTLPSTLVPRRVKQDVLRVV